MVHSFDCFPFPTHQNRGFSGELDFQPSAEPLSKRHVLAGLVLGRREVHLFIQGNKGKGGVNDGSGCHGLCPCLGGCLIVCGLLCSCPYQRKRDGAQCGGGALLLPNAAVGECFKSG